MRSYILHAPALTEKSLQQAQTQNAYTFYVDPHANKNQIREAVEKAYGVHVIGVRTVKLAGRTARTGRKRLEVTQQGKKKAIVVLKQGEKIESFDIQG